VVFPAESSAEKEGTIVHPDGRVQRLRAAIAHPGQIRATWSVIAELAKRAGLDLNVLTSPMAFRQLVDAVPFYEGLTLEELGGRGVRWPARPPAASLPRATTPLAPAPGQTSRIHWPPASLTTSLRLGTYRSIWAAPEVEISPALQFTVAEQFVELSPGDAGRLGIGNGEVVEVSQNGTRLKAHASIRTGVPEGTAFLAAGIARDSANVLTEPLVEVRKV
jgi:NADH-quinone oxidoreductase subunit G